MKLNDLASTFNCRAEEEIENMRKCYKLELEECGKDQIILTLQETMKSAESVDINSWKSALYRALLREGDNFCKWLEDCKC